MASMDKMMKECMKPHSLAHTAQGIGLGLILVALVPSLAANGLMLGIIVLVVAIAYDMMAGGKS